MPSAQRVISLSSEVRLLSDEAVKVDLSVPTEVGISRASAAGPKVAPSLPDPARHWIGDHLTLAVASCYERFGLARQLQRRRPTTAPVSSAMPIPSSKTRGAPLAPWPPADGEKTGVEKATGVKL